MRYLNQCSAVLVTLLLIATQADAQRGRQSARGTRASRTLEVEQLLRSHARLELSAEQITALEDLQEDAVQHQRQVEDRMRGLRSQLRADEIGPDQIRDEIRGNSDTAREFREAQRERIRGVLTEDQLAEVNQAGRREARMGRQANRARRRGPRTGRGSNRFRGPQSFQRQRRPRTRGFRGGVSLGG